MPQVTTVETYNTWSELDVWVADRHDLLLAHSAIFRAMCPKLPVQAYENTARCAAYLTYKEIRDTVHFELMACRQAGIIVKDLPRPPQVCMPSEREIG